MSKYVTVKSLKWRALMFCLGFFSWKVLVVLFKYINNHSCQDLLGIGCEGGVATSLGIIFLCILWCILAVATVFLTISPFLEWEDKK